MSLSKSIYDKYTQILKEELIPALGCTEPICIAYACAEARNALGEFPDSMTVECSEDIIKNVKGAVVPNTGNLKGIEAAAAIGAVGGDAGKGLEVLSGVTSEDIRRAGKILKTGFCKVKLLQTAANLHVIVTAVSRGNTSLVELIHTHTNIVRIERNGCIIFKKPFSIENFNDSVSDRTCLNVRDIKEFADTVELRELEKLIRLQIRLNCGIAEEGLSNLYGMGVGANLIKHYGNDIKTRAKAAAAAGSDARMSGCILPVVTNSGSGNQGITVSLPVIEYAKYLKVPEEELIRALILSNLVAIHQKSEIGRLSAYCGAVSAACGSGAGITYLHHGTYDQICKTITNTLANVSGIICDGAKPSCAAKIASAVDAAIMAHYLSMENRVFNSGDGIIKDNVEKTIESVGKLSRYGMKETDHEILKIMLES